MSETTIPIRAKDVAWPDHWTAQGQPWRVRPEINPARQAGLRERLVIVADYQQGRYPFLGVALTRGDVEWLLATHQSGGLTGPVEAHDGSQIERRGLDLRGANLCGVDLRRLPLARTRFGMPAAEWLVATEEQRELAPAHLEGAQLFKAHLERAHFIQAHLEGADLRLAHMEGAVLYKTHLEGTTLPEKEVAELHQCYPDFPSTLPAADLSGAFFNTDTDFDAVSLANRTSCVMVSDVHWGDANLAVISWNRLRVLMLGDERLARQPHDAAGQPKDRETRINEFEKAVRANRQLAVMLRTQGINEQADHFAYRAQLCQRQVWRHEGPRRLSEYLGSWSLDALAGYGYKPGRSFLAYAFVILGFMGLYLLNSQFVAPHLTWNEALVLSMSSFHGRGFFNSSISLGDTYAQIAAVEALIGLIIEVSFIATFTQRFFGK